MKTIAQNTCGDSLVSIRQFGSVLDGEYKQGTSDIDIIILVNDACSTRLMETLREQLVQLEIEFDVAGFHQLGPFQRAVTSRTALFKSHFVLHRSVLERQEYSRLFKEAEVLSMSAGSHLSRVFRILLPWRLALANIVSQSRLITGDDALGNYQDSFDWQIEEIRSFLTALAMSALAIIVAAFSEDGTRLSLEATKWYLIDVSSCLLRRRASLADSLQIFQSASTEKFLDNFRRLRAHYSSDRLFSLVCPVFLVWLQLSSIVGRR